MYFFIKEITYKNNERMFHTMKKKDTEQKVKLPCGEFCGHNCADGCIYWNPYDRDQHGRQWCNHYSTYYYPRDRQGCLYYQD
jgi:hypothetical protein